jgi:hypothetical protein
MWWVEAADMFEKLGRYAQLAVSRVNVVGRRPAAVTRRDVPS